MLPLIISVSFALMLPVATPTNAIIFSHGHIKIKDMVNNIFNFDQIQNYHIHSNLFSRCLLAFL